MVLLSAALCGLVVGAVVLTFGDRIRAEYWVYRLERLMEEHEADGDHQHMHCFDPSLKPLEFEKPGKSYQKRDRCEHCFQCIHRQAYADALRAMGIPAIPALRRGLRRDPLGLRLEVVGILEGFGPPAIPGLCEALLNGYPDIREAASRALGKMGPAASQATPALLRALADEAQWVRRQAGDALEKICPAKPVLARCEVHRRELLDGSIPPTRAYYEIDEESDNTTRELILRFPFANDVCIIPFEDKSKRVGDQPIPVRYCPDCRAGKEIWRRDREARRSGGAR